jgi:hypothetical protein
MRRYHHIGIPTTEAKPGETHLKHLKLFVVSHEKSEFGVEWMRFEADAAVPDLVRQVPHVAFEVSDLASELAGREILIPPNSPSDGVRVAFIVENGAPIELLEFTDPNHPARRQQSKILISTPSIERHLVKRRRALDTSQELPANELSSIKQTFPKSPPPSQPDSPFVANRK